MYISHSYNNNNYNILYNLFRRHLAEFPALKEDNPAIGYTDGEDLVTCGSDSVGI